MATESDPPAQPPRSEFMLREGVDQLRTVAAVRSLQLQMTGVGVTSVVVGGRPLCADDSRIGAWTVLATDASARHIMRVAEAASWAATHQRGRLSLEREGVTINVYDRLPRRLVGYRARVVRAEAFRTMRETSHGVIVAQPEVAFLLLATDISRFGIRTYPALTSLAKVADREELLALATRAGLRNVADTTLHAIDRGNPALLDMSQRADGPLGTAEAEIIRRGRQVRQAATNTRRRIQRSAPFMGRQYWTNTSVWEPHEESVSLVEQALRELERLQAPHVIDVGTGSGAIAATIALCRPDARVLAMDISPSAVRYARVNAVRLRARNMTVVRSDLLADTPTAWRGRVNVVVGNIPHVPPAGKLPSFAPEGTYYGDDDDGLGHLRRFLQQAIGVLAPGGTVIVQLWQEQKSALMEFGRTLGYEPLTPDQAGDGVLVLRYTRTGRG